MHRSRLSVLVIFAAAAACSKQDDSAGTDLLSQDRNLVARLEVNQETRQLPLPTACGSVRIAAQPAVENKNKSEELTRQAQDAEMHGNVQQARTLLSQAAQLDATNKSAAYHLARTSETLGDSSAALTAYCRYLALTPTTSESLEARQRVSNLSKSLSRVSAGSVTDSVPARRTASAVVTRRVTREQPVVERRVASAPRQASTPAVSAPVAKAKPAKPVEQRDTSSPSTTGSVADQTSAPNGSATTSREVDGATRTTTGGDVVLADRPAQPVDEPPPSTAPSASRRGSSRTQGAMIGAAGGAIIGAVTGRSVKSAIIGAAAGGVLGGVVGPSINPMGRGIVPYASGTR